MYACEVADHKKSLIIKKVKEALQNMHVKKKPPTTSIDADYAV